MSDEIGYIGEELPLMIRQGAALGPYEATLTYPDGAPVNLAGCTIPRVIKKRWNDAEAVASGTFAITDAAAGSYTVHIAAADTDLLFAGGTLSEPASLGVWQADVKPDAGDPRPLYYGPVRVQRDLHP